SPADVPDHAPGDGFCETGQDNHVCTLRAAIQEANQHAGPDHITLQPNTTYLLSLPGLDDNALNGDLDITDTVTLVGAGPHSTSIDGNGSVIGDRVFQITGTVLISGVAILNGHASSSSGGGILNVGWLTLDNTLIMSNTVDSVNAWGGGIVNYNA